MEYLAPHNDADRDAIGVREGTKTILKSRMLPHQVTEGSRIEHVLHDLQIDVERACFLNGKPACGDRSLKFIDVVW